MAKENNIKEELLKQMDNDFTEVSDAKKNSARKIIDNYIAQVRRLKWITAISWFITILYLLVMHNLKDVLLKGSSQYLVTRDEFRLIRFSDAGFMVLLVIAVLLTYLVYSKSKTLAMLQICTRLANIEEQLKRMSPDG
jgi:hypothetical protein